MMIAIYLLGVAALIAAIAARTLPPAHWVYRAPRLGLAAWHTVIAAIILSVSGAVVSLAAGWNSTVDMVCTWWAWCAEALTGGMGMGIRLAAWLLITVAAVLAARTLHSVITTVRAATTRSREHAHMLTLIARRDDRLGALVVEHPEPAAYALPGRHGHIVITSGALDQLPPEQVAAVLEHERAHTTGRHHLMLAITRALATAFPGIGTFTEAHRQADRLVELCADDIAVCRHRRIDLARALVACAEAATRAPVFAGAAAAHGGDALERVQRLLNPPVQLGWRTRLLITAALLALIALPLSMVALSQIYPALAACLPIN